MISSELAILMILESGSLDACELRKFLMWQDLLRVDCTNSDDLQPLTFGDRFNQNMEQVQLPDDLRMRSQGPMSCALQLIELHSGHG